MNWYTPNEWIMAVAMQESWPWGMFPIRQLPAAHQIFGVMSLNSVTRPFVSRAAREPLRSMRYMFGLR